jgi:hypothetical protein
MNNNVLGMELLDMYRADRSFPKVLEYRPHGGERG